MEIELLVFSLDHHSRQLLQVQRLRTLSEINGNWKIPGYLVGEQLHCGLRMDEGVEKRLKSVWFERRFGRDTVGEVHPGICEVSLDRVRLPGRRAHWRVEEQFWGPQQMMFDTR